MHQKSFQDSRLRLVSREGLYCLGRLRVFTAGVLEGFPPKKFLRVPEIFCKLIFGVK